MSVKLYKVEKKNIFNEILEDEWYFVLCNIVIDDIVFSWIFGGMVFNVY